MSITQKTETPSVKNHHNYGGEESFDRLLESINDTKAPHLPQSVKNCDVDIRQDEEQKKVWDERVHDMKEIRYNADTKARRVMGTVTLVTICAWLAATLVLLFLHMTLSDTVLCMLLGTTTATVVGLAVIVLNGYFKIMSQDVDISESKAKRRDVYPDER